MPLTQAIIALENGNLPPRAAAISIDDGYRDNLDTVVPLLKELGLPATFFLTTIGFEGGLLWYDAIRYAIDHWPSETIDFRERNTNRIMQLLTDEDRTQLKAVMIATLFSYPHAERLVWANWMMEKIGNPKLHVMMNEDDVLTLQRAGVEIGGHTHTHAVLKQVSDTEAREEITKNKRLLESVLHRPVKLFAYPNGRPHKDYEDKHVDMVQAAGYVGAVSTSWGVAHPDLDLFQIPRFTPWDKTHKRFMARMIQNYFRRVRTV